MRRMVIGLAIGVLVAACGDSTDPTGLRDVNAGNLDEVIADAGEDIDADTQQELAALAERLDKSEAMVVAIEVPPCDLVTADEVAAATGFPVQGFRETGPTDCLFDLETGAENRTSIAVVVDDGTGALAGPAHVFVWYDEAGSETPYVPVDGIGEAALSAEVYVAVDAGGGQFFGVGLDGSAVYPWEPEPALIEIARAVAGRL